MKYFYIITFDGQIIELLYTADKFQSVTDSWNKGGILFLKEVGGGIHASSISKILSEDLYDSYVMNVKPKLFIKDGTWFDGHERKPVRYEKWKQLEIDAKKKLQLEGEVSEGKLVADLSEEERRKFFDEHMPDFLKKRRELQEKMETDRSAADYDMV